MSGYITPNGLMGTAVLVDATTGLPYTASSGIRNNLNKIKDSNDYVKTFTFLDAGLSTERPDTIVHSSVTLGLSVTETFVWAGVAPAYYISTITLS